MRATLKVTIIGGLHHNTLGVIRALGQKNIKRDNIDVLIIADRFCKNNIISMSNYVAKKNLYYLDSYGKLITELLALKSSADTKRVIICCCDGSAEEVLSHKNELSQYYYLPSIDVDVHQMMNKVYQTEFAKSNGLIVPKSAIIEDGKIGSWDIFPCITKPLLSIDGAGKNDIRISNNVEELRQALDCTIAKAVQIQTYIVKSLEFQLIGCSLNKGEIIIIPGFTDIIRQPNNTNTGYLKYSSISLLNCDINRINDYIKSIGYSGLFSIEFLRSKDNKDYYMEINMRNDGNAYCVTSAGVNLPYIWVYYNVYKQLPKDESFSFDKSLFFIPDLLDLRLGIKHVGLLAWLKQMITAESHSIFNKKDFKPGLIDIFNFITRLIKRKA